MGNLPSAGSFPPVPLGQAETQDPTLSGGNPRTKAISRFFPSHTWTWGASALSSIFSSGKTLAPNRHHFKEADAYRKQLRGKMIYKSQESDSFFKEGRQMGKFLGIIYYHMHPFYVSCMHYAFQNLEASAVAQPVKPLFAILTSPIREWCWILATLLTTQLPSNASAGKALDNSPSSYTAATYVADPEAFYALIFVLF